MHIPKEGEEQKLSIEMGQMLVYAKLSKLRPDRELALRLCVHFNMF